jgi:hypothetical protein
MEDLLGEFHTNLDTDSTRNGITIPEQSGQSMVDVSLSNQTSVGVERYTSKTDQFDSYDFQGYDCCPPDCGPRWDWPPTAAKAEQRADRRVTRQAA